MLCHSPMSYRGICGSLINIYFESESHNLTFTQNLSNTLVEIHVNIIVDVVPADGQYDHLINITKGEIHNHHLDIKYRETLNTVFDIGSDVRANRLINVTGARRNSTVINK